MELCFTLYALVVKKGGEIRHFISPQDISGVREHFSESARYLGRGRYGLPLLTVGNRFRQITNGHK